MCRIRSVLLSLLTAVVVAGCAASAGTRPDAAAEANRGLIGAWIVTASRPGGVGKNLLTFSSDGTFFRSGDTHPANAFQVGGLSIQLDGAAASLFGAKIEAIDLAQKVLAHWKADARLAQRARP